MAAINDKKYFTFIDAENVRNSIESYGYTDMDYNKLYDWLTKSKEASRVYLYVGVEQNDKEKEKKFKELQKTGYFVSIKTVMSYKQKVWNLETTCPSCRHKFVRRTYIKDKKKANCDAEMTLDIIRFGVRKKYKGIIAFSANGDFAPVYKYVAKELKKDVIVYAPLGQSSLLTSLKIKGLAKDKTITLEDLNTLSLHYAEKIEPKRIG